jgi:hypothetical protein
MAIKQVKVSDLSNQEGADVTAVIREYPGLDSAKALDVTVPEMEALVAKALTDVVVIELRLPDTSTKEVMLKKSDADKWLVKPDEILAAARGLKGRVPGYSPRANGG